MAKFKKGYLSDKGENGTAYKLSKEEATVSCFGYMFSKSFKAAFTEEPTKLIPLAMFARRDWIADPFAFLVYGFLVGTTFCYLLA